MRSRRVILIVLLLIASAGASAAQEVAHAAVAVNARFSSRTSLKVSSDVLWFDVADPTASATAVIEFSAGARTSDGDVVLTVEPLRAIDGPGGAADVEARLTVSGEGEGLLAGAHVNPAHATIVGRWRGSGLRSGRLVFSLRANAAGNYSVPVRFVLSTP